MKTAIYIEDGVVQVVLTPESDFEKTALRMFEDKEHTSQIFSGSFYDCRGGWVRQTNHYHSTPFGDSNERSLIIKIEANTDEIIDAKP